MAQENQVTKRSKTYIAQESTFGSVPGTMYDLATITDTFDVSSVAPKEIDNLDESTYLYDNKNTVVGITEGSIKFDFNVKVGSAQLGNATGQAVTSHTQLFEGIFGGMASNTGSLATASSVNTVTVTGSTGTRFSKGNWISVVSGSSAYPRKITNISSNVLTFYPNFPSDPVASGSTVCNSTVFYPTQDNVRSLSVQHTLASSGLQWQFVGCTGDVQLSLARGDLIKGTATLMVASASYMLASASLATSVYNDTAHSKPLVVNNAITWLQSNSTTTALQYPLESAQIKMTFGMVHIPELGGIDGKNGTFRTGERIFAEATVKVRVDTAMQTNWQNQTDMFFAIAVPYGSGASRQWWVFEMPTAQIVGEPKSNNEGGRATLEFVLRSKPDGLVSGASSDAEKAPCRVVWV